MEPLDIAIQFSDLFEATGTEGGLVAQFIDSDIMPGLRSPLSETDSIGLGARFTKVLDQVRQIVGQDGSDSIRHLKEMMKVILTNYAKKTQDSLTARNIFHKAIMQGMDTMLTVTAAGLLANAFAGQHPRQATQLMQQIGSRLTGKRPMKENASGSATGGGAFATVVGGAKGKKTKIRRRESIFAEISWRDLQNEAPTIELIREIACGDTPRHIGGIVIDPTTAELVLATHTALNPERKGRYEAKSVSEMVRIANWMVKQGGIQVVMEEV